MSNSRVTTMTYDLDTRNDSNIDQEVKVLLGAKGWNFTIPERRQIKYYGKNVTKKDVEAPDTTAWKAVPDYSIKKPDAKVMGWRLTKIL